jgi:hypothetical protein
MTSFCERYRPRWRRNPDNGECESGSRQVAEATTREPHTHSVTQDRSDRFAATAPVRRVGTDLESDAWAALSA